MPPPDMSHDAADHRDLLRGQSELQSAMSALAAAQGQTLKAIEGMRSDMREMMSANRSETRQEVKEIRERVERESDDLHSRINETDRIAREAKTKVTWCVAALSTVGGVAALVIVGALLKGVMGG